MFQPCIVIPVYNHGSQIGPTIAALRQLQLPCLLINDGSNTDKQLQKILTGMRAKKVQETLIIYGKPSHDDLQLLAQTGEAFAEALAMGAF